MPAPAIIALAGELLFGWVGELRDKGKHKRALQAAAQSSEIAFMQSEATHDQKMQLIRAKNRDVGLQRVDYFMIRLPVVFGILWPVETGQRINLMLNSLPDWLIYLIVGSSITIWGLKRIDGKLPKWGKQ